MIPENNINNHGSTSLHDTNDQIEENYDINMEELKEN